MDSLEKRFPHYSKLLRLYPQSYQKEYSEQMLQTLADMLDAEPEHKPAIWMRTIIDLPLSLAMQQLKFAGGIMTQQMPTFVKRNALISAALLLPFAVALVANGFDKLIYNHTLYHSWLWQMPALAVWVLWLPIIAAVLALVSLLALCVQHEKSFHLSALRKLLDIHYTWPLLVPALAALCIIAMVFGHDSAHCVSGNPIREVHNWHQTWQCIEQR